MLPMDLAANGDHTLLRLKGRAKPIKRKLFKFPVKVDQPAIKLNMFISRQVPISVEVAPLTYGKVRSQKDEYSTLKIYIDDLK